MAQRTKRNGTTAPVLDTAIAHAEAGIASKNTAEQVNINKHRPDREMSGEEKIVTLTTSKLPDKTVGEIPQAVKDGIIAGHIAHQIEEVKVSAKISPTKKDETRAFDAFYALDAEGMLILSAGKVEPQTATDDLPKDATDAVKKELRRKGACDYFNYGRILDVRQVERGILEDSIEGAEKAINKQVKLAMDGNQFDTDDEARTFIIARWKKVGRLPEDYVYPTATVAETPTPATA